MAQIRNALGQFTSGALIAEERRRRLLKITVTEGLIGGAIWGELDSLLSGKGFTLFPVPTAVAGAVETVAREAEQAVGAPIFQSIFGAALGAGVLDAMQRDAPDALKIIERVIGFTVGLPFGTTQVHDAVKALLGDHAPEHLLQAIEKLPAELGMNFFIPQIMADVVNVATGVPLREAIAAQTRPFRLEWPQLRALARQHAFTEDELNRRLRLIGVREEDLPLIGLIDRQLLPVGDLQAAYLAGIKDEGWVAGQLDQLGFDNEAKDVILQLYLHRAETAGGDQLRTVAHQGFLEDHLTAGQYRAILEQVNVPEASIVLELQAAEMVKSWQQHRLTLGEIRALTVDGQLTDPEALQRVQELGYDAADAGRLVQSWHKAARAAHAGLTSGKVLAYLAHSVLTPVQAYDYLIGLGIRAADARFLVDHPTFATPVSIQPVTESAVISAYLDDVIDRTRAAELLTAIPVTPAQIDLLLRTADAKLAKGPKPKAAHKGLSEAQVMAAFQLGLASDTWAIRELVTLGYSDQDAQLLVATEQTRLDKRPPAGWVTLT